MDVTADFSSTRRYAGIVDATISRAIRAGVNEVDVTYYRTGSAEPQTMHATLDVPAGTDLSGYLIVMSATDWSEYYSDYFSSGERGASAPLTLAETKELVDGLPTNGDVIVAYVPDSSDPTNEDMYSGPTPAAESIVPGDWVFSGGVEKRDGVGDGRRSGAQARLGTPITPHGLPCVARPRRAGGHLLPGGRQARADGAHGHRDRGRRRTGWRCSPPCCRASGTTSWSRPRSARCPHDSLPGADQVTVKVRGATRLAVTRRGGRLVLDRARLAGGRRRARSSSSARCAAAGWPPARATIVRGTARTTVSGGGVTRVRARFGGGSTQRRRRLDDQDRRVGAEGRRAGHQPGPPAQPSPCVVSASFSASRSPHGAVSTAPVLRGRSRPSTLLDSNA